MTKRMKFTLAVCASPLCFAAAAAVFAPGPLNGLISAVNSAGSVKIAAASVTLGSSAQPWKLVLSKGNMFRLTDASGEVVADGKTVTTYLKEKNVYYTEPETKDSAKDVLSTSQLSLWRTFFDKAALGTPVPAVDQGDASVSGQDLKKVTVTLPAGTRKSATVYIDPSTSLPVKLQLVNGSDTSSAMIVSYQSVTTAAALTAADFVFTPPSGATKIDKDSLMTAKWYTNLDDAKADAAKTGRFVFVDFMATWCGPCHMLHDNVFETPEFKKLSKYFVFCQIDTDQQPALSKQYNITALPTQDVLDSNGKVLDQRVGYSNPEDFYNFIAKWEKSATSTTP